MTRTTSLSVAFSAWTSHPRIHSVISSSLNLSTSCLSTYYRCIRLGITLSTPVGHSFDRYRNVLKGTWRDEPKPAAGQTFDLGAHLIDQVVTLFGRPKSVTAFIENIRGIGSPEVDDSVRVSRIRVFTHNCSWICFIQFTIILRYPQGSVSPHPFTAIIRAHILSVRTIQPRFIVRGTKGTFIKHGLDRQEDRLRVMPKAECIHEAGFGVEPESMWGELHSLKEDGSVVKST